MVMNKHIPTLDRPATYEVVVPGRLDDNWSDWAEGLVVTFTCVEELLFSTLTCTVDQAALQGLLRRLYAQGLPLISVTCVECVQDDSNMGS